MTRDETIALFLQGREAWNAWAEAMLAERKALEEAGRWAAEKDWRGVEQGQNDETRDWLARAAADFSGCVFVAKGLGGKDAAGEIEDDNDAAAAPVKSISVDGPDIDFSGFVFPGTAFFSSATFTGAAFFFSATFTGAADFRSATFTDTAFFSSATFTGAADFSRATFTGAAFFSRAAFTGAANFEDAVFESAARFIETQFCVDGGKADFFQATFRRFATFGAAHFHRAAGFTAISAERAFELRGATFDTLPDFTQANFREAPRLDNLKLTDKVEPGGFWRPVPGDAEADAVANHRSLRRLAIQAHDHANEQKFLRGEIRARRGNEDKPWQAAYWMGVLYDSVSDFGRSIARPFWLWALSAAAFAALYLALSVNGLLAPACTKDNPGSPVLDALYLAYKNALLVIGWESEQKLNAVHACLYGAANAPSTVALIQLGQNLVSAVLLFLLLLGVHNRFKIK